MLNGAVPSFDLEGGLPIALARGVTVAATFSVFGALVFAVAVLPRCAGKMPDATADAIRRSLHRLTLASLAVGLLALTAWLWRQTAIMVDATQPAETLAALPDVLTGTRFGHTLLAQAAALAATGLALGRGRRPFRWRAATGVALVATLLQAGHSHALAMDKGPSLLLLSDGLHLLGAAAWLGQLVPLWLAVRMAPPRAGAMAARWFSPIGKLCLCLIAGSAMVQAWVLVGSVPGLVGTAYGWVVCLKLALFGTLFGFALLNRYRFAPALFGATPELARRTLLRSLALQTGAGLAVLAAAAVLSNLQPAMHMQPVWPFSEQFSLDTVREDADFRNEVIGAGLALAGAAVLMIVAVLLRHWARGLAVAGAAGVAWLAIPHFDLLFVPAYPTSFYRSPTGFAATAIVRGAALFPAQCAACHGAEGRGDGPAAHGLPVPPADLTAGHLWMHADGELFWWLTHGIDSPEGDGLAMPGFGDRLSEEERWDLIDYIRAHNAGLVVHATGAWSPPLQAPGLEANCADGGTPSLADLRGLWVRLVIGGPAPAASDRVVTILATAEPGAHPARGLCVAPDASVPAAYAVVSGLPDAALGGAQFLIDPAGWLRAVQPAGAAPGWNDPVTLAAAIRDLAAHPVAAEAGDDHSGMMMPMNHAGMRMDHAGAGM